MGRGAAAAGAAGVAGLADAFLVGRRVASSSGVRACTVAVGVAAVVVGHLGARLAAAAALAASEGAFVEARARP